MLVVLQLVQLVWLLFPGHISYTRFMYVNRSAKMPPNSTLVLVCCNAAAYCFNLWCHGWSHVCYMSQHGCWSGNSSCLVQTMLSEILQVSPPPSHWNGLGTMLFTLAGQSGRFSWTQILSWISKKKIKNWDFSDFDFCGKGSDIDHTWAYNLHSMKQQPQCNWKYFFRRLVHCCEVKRALLIC